ncbi:hypothetical protein V8E51_008633 [Hyaloscypha variabilis]
MVRKTHTQHVIEWACPPCGSQGDSAATLIDHHTKRHHSDQFTLIFTPLEEANSHLDSFFKIYGHDRVGGQSHLGKGNEHSTHDSAIKGMKGHLRGPPLHTHNLSSDYPHPDSAFFGSPGQEERAPDSEDDYQSWRGGSEHANDIVHPSTTVNFPQPHGHGSVAAMYSHPWETSIPSANELSHATDYGTHHGSPKSHHGDKDHHLAEKLHGTDAHNAAHEDENMCKGCHQGLPENIMMHVEHDTAHRDSYSCWHCGAMFGHKHDQLLKHLSHEHAKKERNQHLRCAHGKKCHEKFHNSFHLRQHLTIVHHDKMGQEDYLDSQADDKAKDHNNSHLHENGKGKGKDHNKSDGLVKDSQSHESAKDHGKLEGEEKGSDKHGKEKDHAKLSGHETEAKYHGKDNGKDHDKSLGVGQENKKDHSTPDGHEKGKDHAKSDSKEKVSQGHGKETDQAKEEKHSKETKYAEGQEHAKDAKHSKENTHPKEKGHAEEKEHPKDNGQSQEKKPSKENEHLKGTEHQKVVPHGGESSKPHEHGHDDDGWVDEPDSTNKRGKAAKKPKMSSSKKTGKAAKSKPVSTGVGGLIRSKKAKAKPARSGMGLFRSKKK